MTDKIKRLIGKGTFNLHKEFLYELYDWAKLRYESTNLKDLISAIQRQVTNAKLDGDDCIKLFKHRYTPYPKPPMNEGLTTIDFKAIAPDYDTTHTYLCPLYKALKDFIVQNVNLMNRPTTKENEKR